MKRTKHPIFCRNLSVVVLLFVGLGTGIFPAQASFENPGPTNAEASRPAAAEASLPTNAEASRPAAAEASLPTNAEASRPAAAEASLPTTAEASRPAHPESTSRGWSRRPDGGGEWQFRFTLEGLDNPLRKPVTDYLAMPDPKRIHPFSVRRFCRNAPDTIRKALSSFGYYSAAIEAGFTQEAADLHCHLRVALNDPVRIRRVKIEVEGPGADSPQFSAAIARFPLRRDDVLIHARYEAGKSELAELAVALGYFDMNMVRSAVRVYPEEHAADIDIRLVTGERYHFGPVVFSQGPLSDEFLQRFVGFQLDDPYEARRILQLRQDLMNSRYFRTVRVDRFYDDSTAGDVLIYVDYELNPKFNYKASVGFGTDTGPRVGLGVENRHVGEMGNRFNVTSLLSTVRKEFGVTYMIPRTTPLKDRYEISIAYRSEEVEGVGSELLTLRGQRVYVREGRWTQIQSLRYQQETTRVASTSNYSRLLIPGIQWRQGKSNNLIYPTRGWRALIDLSAGHDALLSDLTFVQGRSELKWVSSPFNRTRLLARGEAGGTLVDEFVELPASLRFFAGGDHSVRGYTYKSLGPSRNGQVIGGRFLLTGTLEADYLVAPKWGVAAFTDLGNAFDTGEYTLKKSAGAGVRWFSPIGPIRLDLAWPLGDSGKSYRIHLSMGPDI